MKLHPTWLAAVLTLVAPLAQAQPVGDWFVMRTAPGGAFMSLSDESGTGSLMHGCTRRQCMWILSRKGECKEGDQATFRLFSPKATEAVARCLGASQINTGLHDWMFLDEAGIAALSRRGAKFRIELPAVAAVAVSLKFNAYGGARAYKRLQEMLAAE